jgi:hypothetical protein
MLLRIVTKGKTHTPDAGLSTTSGGLYLVTWRLFRVAGKRSLRDMTAFDFVLPVHRLGVTQQGLIGKDYSGHRRGCRGPALGADKRGWGQAAW